jgi:hypothetical protein
MPSSVHASYWERGGAGGARRPVSALAHQARTPGTRKRTERGAWRDGLRAACRARRVKRMRRGRVAAPAAAETGAPRPLASPRPRRCHRTCGKGCRRSARDRARLSVRGGGDWGPRGGAAQPAETCGAQSSGARRRAGANGGRSRASGPSPPMPRRRQQPAPRAGRPGGRLCSLPLPGPLPQLWSPPSCEPLHGPAAAPHSQSVQVRRWHCIEIPGGGGRPAWSLRGRAFAAELRRRLVNSLQLRDIQLK